MSTLNMTSRVGYKLSSSVAATQSPPIPVARLWLEEYVISGSPHGDVLDLSQGVPSGAPHPILMQALAQAVTEEESYKYGPILGNGSLRQAVAADLAEAYQCYESPHRPSPEDIAITTGCNMAFMALMQALCVTGDQVMLPTPSYFSHTMTTDMLALETIYLPSTPDNSFIPTVNFTRAAELVTDRTRAVVLVTPNNPTGAIYPDHVLQEWYEFAKEHGIALVLDETYRDFMVDRVDPTKRARPHRLYENEDWRETLVSLCSFSKSYRLPGHRLGSVVGSPEMLKALNIVLDCMQICAPRAAQLALAKAMPLLRSDVLASAHALDHRMSLFRRHIQAIDGWNVVSSGGFFAYVECPTNGESSEAFARDLAAQYGLLTLPHTFFAPKDALGDDKWLRFAVANVSDKVIDSIPLRIRAAPTPAPGR